MSKRIVYPNDEGGVAVVIPASECPLSLEEIADQVIPAGKPFKIINTADLPATERNSWVYEDFLKTPVVS